MTADADRSTMKHSGRALPAGQALLSPGFRLGLAICVISLFSIVYQARWGTVTDVSWLITACERMLGGERLYVDIYETNPPFSVWLYLPPVALAGVLGVAPEAMVFLWTYICVFAGLGLCAAVISRADFNEKEWLLRSVPLVFAVLILFPGNSFEQREHLGLALFLPLLALHAWRAEGGRPPIALAVLVGVAATVLLVVKPYYAVLVLASVLVPIVRRRSVQPLFASEHWLMGSLCVAYGAAVSVFHPTFLSDIYPTLTDVYGPVRVFEPIVFQYGIAWTLMMLIAWRRWPKDRFPALAAVCLAASAAALLPLFYQGKGWPYHAYPAIALAILGLICLYALPERTQASGTGILSGLRRPSPLLAVAVVVLAYLPFSITQKPSAELVETVRAAIDRPTVGVISSDISAGHPLTRLVGGRFVETYVSDWLGAFSLYLSQKAEVAGDQAEAQRYRAILETFLDKKRNELETRKPDILIIEPGDTFWVPKLLNTFGFDRILAGYALIGEDERLQVYLRRDRILDTAELRPAL